MVSGEFCHCWRIIKYHGADCGDPDLYAPVFAGIRRHTVRALHEYHQPRNYSRRLSRKSYRRTRLRTAAFLGPGVCLRLVYFCKIALWIK